SPGPSTVSNLDPSGGQRVCKSLEFHPRGGPVTLKVLAADDSATMRKVLEMTFAAEDVEVLIVSSGDDAIAQCASFQPSDVLADASMATDGYEVARSIKASGSAAAVIVMASQHNPF